MTRMERRLQLLLDQARYDRVEREAKRSGESVASVIRNAIDVAYPDIQFQVNEAWQVVLDFQGDDEPAFEWSAVKAELEADLAREPR